MESLFDKEPGTRAGIVPRCYQVRDHDETFRLWDSGEVGVLTRAATGSGKTLMACLKIDTWLRRGADYRAMVVSYETQLVWQFAQEVEEYIGIVPGIEMDSQAIDPDDIPNVCVVSRASLLRATPPSVEQIAELDTLGIKELGAVPARICKRFLSYLKKGGELDQVRDEIERLNREPEAHGKHWSRLHKFDPKLNWLLIFDEAHRHAHHLASVGPIVDWFDQNPTSRRNGITATPKRGNGVSIGHKMFPGVALDYPLYSPSKPCAVKDGFAVPYVQKYIEVQGVDFRSLAKLGSDFDEAELEKKLGEEKTLATLVLPLLDLVGDRRALIFSPGVEMAKNVARFINARVETKCVCGKVKWYPRALIGDGAACECKHILTADEIVKGDEQARQLDGTSHPDQRKETYKAHQAGEFQFLSVCGLCREGYNDPGIACVAVFRPVSKKASSLAEQMKGRSCRPLRGILNGLTTKEERLAAIAASSKPYALIVDLVGITGLADCASTAQIYAEGLADVLEEEGHVDAEAMAEEIAARAEQILAERGLEGEVSVEEAIQQAKKENEDARAKVREERERAEERAREEAELRAKAGAQANYTEHDVGVGTQTDPLAATDAQYKFMRFLGMDINVLFSKKKAGRIINQLRQRMPLDQVAHENRLEPDQWLKAGPSSKQLSLMQYRNVPTLNAKTGYDASLLLDARLSPDEFGGKRMAEIEKARNNDELNAIGMDLRIVSGVLRRDVFAKIAEAGKRKRESFAAPVEDF